MDSRSSPSWVYGKAAQFKIHKLAAARMRIRFLLDRICETNDPVLQVFNDRDFDEVFYLLKTMHKATYQSKDSISDSDIQAAKEYPIDQLVNLTHGKVTAWCHDDSKPSLVHWKKKNLLRCFVCNQTFNPIDVLMTRDGMGFIEAVKTLR